MLATIKGIVRAGAIVPEKDLALPEGTVVQISLPLPDMPPDLQAEFTAWDRASDEAWKLIDAWEAQDE